MYPGLMQLTLIFFFAKSIAKDLVKASTPPLLATYPGLSGKPNFAFMLEILISRVQIVQI